MQILLNGMISGAAIGLLAVAFQLVYLPTRVFFVGLAGIYALAPFLTRFARAAGLGWSAAIGLTVAACALISLLCELLNHGPLARRRASDSAHLIASLGTYIIFVQAIAMIWGSDTKMIGAGAITAARLGGSIVTGAQQLTLGISIALLSAFAILLLYSDLGLRLRGLADNPSMFALFGYDVSRHRLFAFMMAGIFASAASLGAAYDLGFSPYGGLHAVLLAVIAIIIGGRASFLGPVIGAVMLGVLRAQVVWQSSARWQEAATFGLLVLFLLFRPQGLLGRASRVESAS